MPSRNAELSDTDAARRGTAKCGCAWVGRGAAGMVEQNQTVTWVVAARRGDSTALAKLLATYHPRLRARAAARMDAALRARLGPEDILQEVYLQVFRQIGRFEERGPGSFLNWVYTILDHKLVDTQRAAHRHVRDIDREVAARGGAASDSYWSLLDQVFTDSGTPSHVFRRQEAYSALLTCIAGLSNAHRQVIQLRFLEGLSVAEVAARLDKSETAVVAVCQRALKALREAMDRQGEFSWGT